MNAPLNIDIIQILLHILNLVILVGGLSLLVYKPVKKFLDEREKRISDETEANRTKAEECEKLKAEYEKKLLQSDESAAQLLKEAEQKAAKEAADYLSDAKAKADEIIKAAEADAEARKEHILESAQTEIGELVLSAAQKLLADAATPENDSALYDIFVKTAKAPDGKKDGGDE